MDGYLYTPSGAEALQAGRLDDHVRYACTFDDGSGFLAWDDRPPSIFGTCYTRIEMDDAVWPWAVVRRAALSDDSRIYMVTSDVFRALVNLDPSAVEAAVLVSRDGVIVQATVDVPITEWGGRPNRGISTLVDA